MLAALAHPLRRAILDALLAQDLPRVKDLAEALDRPANQLSFHLRVLEDAGLVDRVRSEADRRESRWRLRSRDWRIAADASSPAGTMGFLEAEHVRESQKLRAVFDAAARHIADPAGALDAELVAESLLLTDDQAMALFRDLTRVIAEHAKASGTDPGQRRWFATSYVVADRPGSIDGAQALKD